MPDPLHIPGYDAWKTSGPDETPQYYRKYANLWITLDLTEEDGESAQDIAKEIREACVAAIQRLGLSTDDFEVEIDHANEEFVPDYGRED